MNGYWMEIHTFKTTHATPAGRTLFALAIMTCIGYMKVIFPRN